MGALAAGAAFACGWGAGLPYSPAGSAKSRTGYIVKGANVSNLLGLPTATCQWLCELLYGMPLLGRAKQVEQKRVATMSAR